MTDAVESMAWKGQVPWHGLGVEIKENLSPAQMLKAASLTWTVSKRPLFIKKGNGNFAQIEESSHRFAIVRDTDESVLSVCGTGYRPVQNEAAFEFFAKFVKAGKMTMETAGSLWGGRYVWALARIGMDFKVGTAKGNADEVRGYLLLMSPHVAGKALVCQFTPVRVVCWNTLSMALGEGLRGSKDAFRMAHSTEFNDITKTRAEQALGLAVGQMTEFKDAAALLSKKKAKPEAVEQYFCEVLQYDPKSAKKSKRGDGDKTLEPTQLPKFREALEHGPGSKLGTAAGTWWGALNAVTYVVDHEVGKDRNIALRSAWLGGGRTLKERALALAVKEAA